MGAKSALNAKRAAYIDGRGETVALSATTSPVLRAPASRAHRPLEQSQRLLLRLLRILRCGCTLCRSLPRRFRRLAGGAGLA